MIESIKEAIEEKKRRSEEDEYRDYTFEDALDDRDFWYEAAIYLLNNAQSTKSCDD